MFQHGDPLRIMSRIKNKFTAVEFERLPAACPFDLFECLRRSNRKPVGENLDRISRERCIPTLKAARQVSLRKPRLVRKTVGNRVKFTAALFSHATNDRIGLKGKLTH